MLWKDGRRSSNVDDRRGVRVSRGGVMGGGIGTIILVLVALYFGVDPSVLLEMGSGGAPTYETSSELRPESENQLAEFAAVVLADTEEVWAEVFRRNGKHYTEPTLVLFTGMVESACGFAQAAVGPFYCPADQKVYIDLSFFHELKERFQAPGDFAQAYVIAHEIGHHVQNLMGTMREVANLRGQVSQAQANTMMVRMELQADCFSGVWANHANRLRQILEPGDIEEALTAASAIGDDRLQRQSQGYVVPDSFTHGTSAQRARWFRRGFENGVVDTCDTFNAPDL